MGDTGLLGEPRLGVAPVTTRREPVRAGPALTPAWFGALLIGLLLLVAAFATYRLFDFRIFYDASHRLLSGGHIYPTRAAIEQRTRDYYVLPPIVAVLVVALSHLPFAVAGTIWTLAMVSAIAASLRLLGVTDLRCYLIVMLWLPVVETVALGTIEPLLVIGLALAWRYRDRPWRGSVPLGIAIALKLIIWPVLLWLLLTKRLRRCAETLTVALAAVLLPWAVTGFDGLGRYPHMLSFLSQTEHAEGWGLPGSSLVGPAILIAAAITVAAVALLVRSEDGDRRAFSAAVIACLLLSPLVWLHYYVLLIVPVALTSRRFSWVWLIPVLACYPVTSTGSLGVKMWIWAVLALTAFAVLRAPSTSARAQT